MRLSRSAHAPSITGFSAIRRDWRILTQVDPQRTEPRGSGLAMLKASTPTEAPARHIQIASQLQANDRPYDAGEEREHPSGSLVGSDGGAVLGRLEQLPLASDVISGEVGDDVVSDLAEAIGGQGENGRPRAGQTDAQ